MASQEAIQQLERLLKGAGQVWLAFDADGCLTHVSPTLAQAGTLADGEVSLIDTLVFEDVVPVSVWLQAQPVINEHGIWQSILPLGRGLSGNLYTDITLTSMKSPDGSETRMVALRSLSDPYEVGRMKKSFMRMVMHELRTPLMAIKGLSNMLGEDLESTEINAQEYTELIEDSADGLIGVVEKIVKVVKIQAGDVWLATGPVAVADLAREMAEKMADRAGAYEQRIEIIAPDDLPPVLADADVIRQVLENLLENALTFAGRGATIQIEATQAIAPDGLAPCVVLRIADDGMGVRVPRRMDIFEAFVRGDPAGTRLPPGTGLGLTITRALLELIGGAIRVESKVGEGSAFIVTLPIAGQDRSVAINRRAASGEPETLLIVAPGGALYPELQQRFEDGGYAVLCCEDPGEAASLIEERLPLVVLVGMQPDAHLSERDLAPIAEAAAGEYIPLVTFAVTHLSDGSICYRLSDPLPAPQTLERTFRRVNLLANQAYRHQRHVLLVEDDIMLREMVAAALALRQLNVEIAATAERARELVHNDDFDLVLLDYKLKDGNGLELLAEIRELHRLAGIPAIIMTGVEEEIPEILLQASQLGAVEVLRKPVQIDELVSQIHGLLVN